MAFTEAALGARVIERAEFPVEITLKSGIATVNPGDVLGYSSGWLRAKSAATAITGRLVALERGEAGATIKAARRAVVSGFTGATAGGTVYTSDTGATDGAWGESAGSTSDKVGLFISATAAIIEPQQP